MPGNPKGDEDLGCQLYLITPPVIDDLAAFKGVLEQTLAAGPVACVQLRLKDIDDDSIRIATETLMPVCHAHDVAFILNDRPDLAVVFGCDGVHIGAEDRPYADTRRIMGPTAIVGVTCRDSRHLAMELADAGADYVAFGAFYPTTTKDTVAEADIDILEVWSETTNVPCVAIGGITVENCAPLVAAGADFIAVSSGVWNYKDGPAAAVKAFNTILADFRA